MKRLWTRCAPPVVPFVAAGVVLSFPVELKRFPVFDSGVLFAYFAFNSAMERIAPVCFTAEPELSVDALDSVLGARAAARCGVGTSDAEGLLGAAAGFVTTGAVLRWFLCRDPTDSSSVSPSLDA